MYKRGKKPHAIFFEHTCSASWSYFTFASFFSKVEEIVGDAVSLVPLLGVCSIQFKKGNNLLRKLQRSVDIRLSKSMTV